ncbi:ligand-binding sensor domain-containing protein [Flavitalea flava]
MPVRTLVIFLFFLSLHSMAQHPSLSFRNVGINDGLSQSSVVDIAFDSTGFAWFATQDGLNRFDGKEFLIFRKNFNDITTPAGSRLGKVVCHSSGEIWIITSEGRLERLDRYRKVFISVDTLGAERIALPAVSCFYEDRKHNWWIGTESEGIFLYHPLSGKIKHFNTQSSSPFQIGSNSIHAIFEDKDNQCWILTDNGLMVCDPLTFRFKQFLLHTDKDSHSEKEEQPVSCSSICQDQEGSLWVGTYGKGLFVKRQTDDNFRQSADSLKLPLSLVTQTLLADHSHNIWMGTYGSGLFLINTKAGSVRHINADKKDPFSLSYDDILCIKEDPNGGIWIGTDGGGISHYDKRLNNFSLWSRNNVPDNIPIEQVRAITTDRNKGIWIGTSNSGLVYTNKEHSVFRAFQLPPFKKGLTNYERVVSLMTDRDQKIWVGTQGNGLLIIDNASQKIIRHFYPGGKEPDGLPDHTIWCLLADSGSLVWAGTRNSGLCLLDKNRGLIWQSSEREGLGKSGENPAEKNIRSLTRINDSLICIGFEKNGFQFLNTRTRRFYFPGKLFKGSVNQLEGVTLKCTYYQYPLLWVGTLGQGLLACNLAEENFLWITEKQGLPNNTIYSILPDRLGALWMSTNKGICRLSVPNDPGRINPGHFSLFTREDGIQGNEFNTGAFHRAADGQFYFGGTSGLTAFYPDSLQLTDQPARVAITGMTINNSPAILDTLITYKKTVHLSYLQNSLSFNLAALDFVLANRFTYLYRLQGHDTGWIDAGTRNFASYTTLPPGHYTFQVKALRQFSDNLEPITSLSIIIEPPFWRTWWFISCCILAFCWLLYAFYRYRIRQLIRLQTIRERIATDLHDDIGSTLTNIGLLSELSRKNLSRPEEAGIFLHRISREVESSSQALDDIVWSINTNHDTLEQTVARMRRYAAEIFDAANINYELQLDGQFEQRKLNMEHRRDFFLVFKEAINNIYKHAGASQVLIRIMLEGNRLIMEIKDNGKGFDPSMLTHRNGIKNMRLRMEKWKGTVQIDSVPGGGTRILTGFSIR